MSSDNLKLPDHLLAEFLYPELKEACEIFLELVSPIPSLLGMLRKVRIHIKHLHIQSSLVGWFVGLKPIRYISTHLNCFLSRDATSWIIP
jgi:hypothetical protein